MNESSIRIRYDLPQNANIDTDRLAQLFENRNQSYKFLWFQAILKNVSEGKRRLTFDELIDNMIADAWTLVTVENLNMGPADTLERLIRYIYQYSGLPTRAEKESILEHLKYSRHNRLRDEDGKYYGTEVTKRKTILTKNVPYRLQAPFLDKLKGDEWNIPEWELAEQINAVPHLIYYFHRIDGLQSELEVTPEWADYFNENHQLLHDWTQGKFEEYLQRRNPDVLF